MAKTVDKEATVTPAVSAYLAANGRKGGKIGGATTKRLIELGKQAEAEGESRKSRTRH